MKREADLYDTEWINGLTYYLRSLNNLIKIIITLQFLNQALIIWDRLRKLSQLVVLFWQLLDCCKFVIYLVSISTQFYIILHYLYDISCCVVIFVCKSYIYCHLVNSNLKHDRIPDRVHLRWSNSWSWLNFFV